MPAPVPRFVGIDVSKAHLDIALLPDDTTFRVSNDGDGWAVLIDRPAATVDRAQSIDPVTCAAPAAD